MDCWFEEEGRWGAMGGVTVGEEARRSLDF